MPVAMTKYSFRVYATTVQVAVEISRSIVNSGETVESNQACHCTPRRGEPVLHVFFELFYTRATRSRGLSKYLACNVPPTGALSCSFGTFYDGNRYKSTPECVYTAACTYKR